MCTYQGCSSSTVTQPSIQPLQAAISKEQEASRQIKIDEDQTSLALQLKDATVRDASQATSAICTLESRLAQEQAVRNSLETALKNSTNEAGALRSALQEEQQSAEQLHEKLAEALQDKDQAFQAAEEAKSELAALHEQCDKDLESHRRREAGLQEELTAAAATTSADLAKLKVSTAVWPLAHTMSSIIDSHLGR